VPPFRLKYAANAAKSKGNLSSPRLLWTPRRTFREVTHQASWKEIDMNRLKPLFGLIVLRGFCH
jgi:hypothetical protein